jgi:hypothetical protein
MASVRVDKVQCLNRLNLFLDKHAEEIGESVEMYACALEIFVKQADARLPALYRAWRDIIRGFPADHQEWLVRAWEAAYDVRAEDVAALTGRAPGKQVVEAPRDEGVVGAVRRLSDGGNVVVRFGRRCGMYTRRDAVGELGERAIDGYVE